MNQKNKGRPPEDTAFEQELKALYQASLLDEAFQQQLAEDLRSLPENSQQQLHPPEQALLQDDSLSKNKLEQLAKIRPACHSTPSFTARFMHKWREFMSPMAIFPATLAAGVLIGLFLPTLLQQLPPDDRMRGHPAVPNEKDTANQTGEQAHETMRQQPQQWLSWIADLLRQGKVVQAREELQAFELRYPDYKTPPSP